MTNDPIVEEIHRIREKMLAECGGDLDKLIERLKVAEAEHPNRVTSVEELRKLRIEGGTRESERGSPEGD